jgi:hypothetical protein
MYNSRDEGFIVGKAARGGTIPDQVERLEVGEK